MTIEQLKQRIREQTDPFFILMASGKDLASENTVGDDELEPLAMIHMISRLIYLNKLIKWG